MFSFSHRFQESVSQYEEDLYTWCRWWTGGWQCPPPTLFQNDCPHPPLEKALFCGSVNNKGRSIVEKVDACSLYSMQQQLSTFPHTNTYTHTQEASGATDNGVRRCPVLWVLCPLWGHLINCILYTILKIMGCVWFVSSRFPSSCCQESSGGGGAGEGRG